MDNGPTLFFQGDLQSGISTALRESKVVVCFVRDDSEESSLWQAEYLADDNVAQVLRDHAVLLRMEADSQEAGFLSAFCPLSRAPTLVAIRGGQLQAHLRAGITKEEFKDRLLSALTGTNSVDVDPTSVDHDQAHPALAMTTMPPGPSPATASRSSASSDPQAASSSSGQAKSGSETAPTAKKTSELSYAQQQRKREEGARAERQRILTLVEQDKIARREREQRRTAGARLNSDHSETGKGDTAGEVQQQRQTSPRSQSGPSSCALQVRLLDGSTIRSRFQPDQTLRQDVRAWVDENRSDGDQPYSFKQILAPLPNRTISISEEEESLLLLGLVPSATLVLFPVQAYTTAYGTASSGLLSRGISAGYGIVSGGLGLVTWPIRTVLGLGNPGRDEVSDTINRPPGPLPVGGTNRTGINVRTLEDQRTSRDDRQFYNGNQLNFEPNRDDTNTP